MSFFFELDWWMGFNYNAGEVFVSFLKCVWILVKIANYSTDSNYLL